MDLTFRPSTSAIAGVFAEEIAELGGAVTDLLDDDTRLFARATLDARDTLGPSDVVRAGIALRVTGPEVVVHPYTFRVVCANGAIHAHAISTRCVDRAGLAVAPTIVERVALDVRAAVRACADPRVFVDVAGEMRSAAQVQADLFIQLMPALAQMPFEFLGHVLPQIFRRFDEDGDRSALGLVNAVTSVARDTPDPALRWRLEELGGAVAARVAAHVGPTARPLPGAVLVG